MKGNAAGQFGSIGSSFQQFAGMLPGGIKNLGGLIGKLGPLALKIGAVVVVVKKLAKVIQEAIDVAADFQKGLLEVSTLVDDTGGNIMPMLEKQVVDLTTTFGKSQEDMLKATYQAISAGVNAERAGEFLGMAGKLAIGGVTDMETAVDGLTSIQNAYGLALEDMTDVSDKMFVAMRAGKTTIGELSGAIGRVAPISAQMEVSIGEVLAMVASLTKGGIQTSEAVTGVRSAMLEVMRASPRFTKAAKKFGIEYDLATVKTMGFSKWLVYANKQITAQGGKLTDLFGNVRAVTAALALSGKQAQTQAEIMEQMGRSAGETEKAFEKMRKGLRQSQAEAKQTRQAFFKELGDIFLPMMVGFAKTKKFIWEEARAALGFIKSEFIAPAVDAFEPWVTAVRNFVGVVYKIVRFFYSRFAKRIAQAFQLALVPFRAIAAVMRGFQRAAARAKEQFVAAWSLISESIEKVRSAVRRVVNVFKALIGVEGKGFGDIFIWITDKVEHLGTVMDGPLVRSVWNMVEKIGNSADWLQEKILAIPLAIVKAYAWAVKTITRLISGVEQTAVKLLHWPMVMMEKTGMMEKGTLEAWSKGAERRAQERAAKVEAGGFGIADFEKRMKDAMAVALKEEDDRKDAKPKEKMPVTLEGEEVNIAKGEELSDWARRMFWRDFVAVR